MNLFRRTIVLLDHQGRGLRLHAPQRQPQPLLQICFRPRLRSLLLQGKRTMRDHSHRAENARRADQEDQPDEPGAVHGNRSTANSHRSTVMAACEWLVAKALRTVDCLPLTISFTTF